MHRNELWRCFLVQAHREETSSDERTSVASRDRLRQRIEREKTKNEQIWKKQQRLSVTYKKPTRTRLIMTTLASFGKPFPKGFSGVHARDFSSLNGFESQIGPSTCHAKARKLAFSVLLGTAKRFAPAEDKTSTIYFRFLELI